MVNSKIRQTLIELVENEGIIIDEDVKKDEGIDCNLIDMISDSIQWISLIVSIETSFGIEWPDEFLSIDNFRSLNTVSKMVERLIDTAEENNESI